MPHFQYKGRNHQGVAVAGVVEDSDSSAVADQLVAQGITPTEIRLGKAASAASSPTWLPQWRQQKVGLPELILFCRQMHTLLKAGVPMLRALAGLQESASNKELGRVLQDLRSHLEAGRELSVALSHHPEAFSFFFISLVHIGETTGTLDQIFLRMSRYLEFEKYMRDQVKSALRYPSFVIVAMALALVIINLFVIPAFAKVYAGFHAQLPVLTRILIHFSHFTVRFWPLLLVVLLAAVMAFRSWTKTASGRLRWDRLKLRLPIAGPIVHKAALARFARSFALASQSSMPIVQGMSMVARVVDNVYIGGKVEQMREGVERGESILRTARNSGVFTPIVLQMMAVGEESGELDNLMQEIAIMYEQDVEYAVKTLGAQIEPVLIVALGILVLILALGVFLPMWDLGHAALASH